MATTTNYGWTTPDDTALVKDGAAAIRTLGSSVDTTTKALNPSTTLGDIEYRSSTANTNTRLGIGTTGQVLAVSGGVPAWTTVASGGMTLINAGGTTLTGASITISSIPSGYNYLTLLVENYRPATDTSHLIMRFNADTGANYKQEAGNISNVVINNSEIYLTGEVDNGASNGFVVSDIFNYLSTTGWRITRNNSLANNPTTTANGQFQATTGVYVATGSAITSLLLKPLSGNFTSGTAYLYGVK